MGYFYSDTIARHKEKQQIKKILCFAVEANIPFFIWDVTLDILRRESIISYIQFLLRSSQ